MNNTHLNYLIQLGDNHQGYVGINSLSWGNSVLINQELDPNLNRMFDRYGLLKYCQNENNNDINVLTAILSWGGMRRDHARKLFNHPTTLLELVAKLRNDNYNTREEAFQAFQESRRMNFLPGLGIGYYTKLICFLAPNINGYIMDQWVSKSINLLIDNKEFIKITNNNWVNDKNTPEIYGSFCQYVDELGQILNFSGFEAEKRLFSVGRGQGQWRNYLIQNY